MDVNMTLPAFSISEAQAEVIRTWVERRTEIVEELASIDAKLDAVRILMPDGVAERMLGAAPTPVRNNVRIKVGTTFASRPFTDLVAWALEGETGGKDTAWIREKLKTDPEVATRVAVSPTAISNSLSRLTERGKLVRVGRFYYLPDTYAKIESGEIKEERIENEASQSFNARMHEVMGEYGKPFTAADAIRCAKSDAHLGPKLEEQNSRVYSWLSREVFRGKLIRDGESYSYPSNENGAAEAAPDAGEVTASSNDHRPGFRLVG